MQPLEIWHNNVNSKAIPRFPDFLLPLQVESITITPSMTSYTIGALELMQFRLKKFQQPQTLNSKRARDAGPDI